MSIYKNGYDFEKTMKVIKEKVKGFCGEFGTCYYRYEDNCCAVGAFIPDDLYKSEMEKKSATIILERFDLSKYMPLSINHMDRLQMVHDDFNEDTDPEDIYKALEDKLKDIEDGAYGL